MILVLFTLSFVSVDFLLAGSDEDIQAIKKAVKKNPGFDEGKEVKWFKVLITDNKTNKEKVKVTLPMSLVEVFIRCSQQKNLRIDRDDYDINLKELFVELKKLGPMALIEVYEEDETVKIWLE